MKNVKTYLAEYQAIRQIETTCIPKHGKTRSKRRQNGRQNTAFYNAIYRILELRRNSTEQQPKRKSDET